MILVDNEILDRVKNSSKYKDVYYKRKDKPLIENFKEENLQSVSYDITITNKIKRFKNEFLTIDLNKSNDIDNSMREEDISNGYLLRPGEYVLVQLVEKLNMPDDLVGHIRPRSSFIKLGLVLSLQHINPSYSGQLQIGLYNATPNAVKIQSGLRIGQILFEKISGIINKENLYFIKKDSKYQGEEGFVSSKIHEELKEKVDEEYKNILKNIRG
ncbi:dCTP deaminase [Clostridium butyricum]|uniref:dCTP deaminase n=1 Tax=Clostridium butyricum TaxID=1492 RepID=UPI002ABDB078|nr:dCTP deaminase [Clostridium butyricum]